MLPGIRGYDVSEVTVKFDYFSYDCSENWFARITTLTILKWLSLTVSRWNCSNAQLTMHTIWSQKVRRCIWSCVWICLSCSINTCSLSHLNELAIPSYMYITCFSLSRCIHLLTYSTKYVISHEDYDTKMRNDVANLSNTEPQHGQQTPSRCYAKLHVSAGTVLTLSCQYARFRK